MEHKLNESSRTPIRSLVLIWINEHGVTKTGDMGKEYKIISGRDRAHTLKILATAMLQDGYTFDEINDPKVSIILVDLCWRQEFIRKLSSSEVKEAKKNLALDWEMALHDPEICGKKMPKVKRSAKNVEEVKEVKKEKELEISPKDRIKLDTSDIIDAPVDEDFLNEIGLDKSFVTGKKNE